MRDYLRNGKLLTLMLGHLTVDSYVGVIPILYPLLIGRFKLSFATVGLVSLAYSGMAAISQPLFGLIADRFGTRFTGLALAWTAITFSVVGFVNSFPLLLGLALASGLGSGAFHPLGALDVRGLLPTWRRSFGMSIYVTAGTVGVAAGPLIGIVLFGAFGMHGTGLLVIPGLATGGYLLWRMRGRVAGAGAAVRQAAGSTHAVPLFALAAVIGVMMSRSWTVNVFQAFTPTWYRQLGYGPEFYGPLATTLVLASAAGTVGCGSLADRYGRRTIILATLVLSVPAVLLFTLYPGPWAFATAILIGVLAASTAPLMLLMAQQLMASRAGLASGLVMGLGFVTGAIGVPINGAIGDAIGLQKSLMTHVILVIATIGIAWFLPREDEIERYAARQEPLRAAGERV
ncbi:MAG: MFS transporter [Chloroflexi bacterium]|nr:MAG: MFS transporter [Chloroflexota bacterium]TME41061.1 MAG: MFS transporter [Chloroflexota bacterium]TME52129.1 MAG: MFS transporter [Chloroflexota bacterium]